MKNYERFIFVAFIAMTIFVEALIVSAPSDVSTSESEIARGTVFADIFANQAFTPSV